jgi:hypothetical protein
MPDATAQTLDNPPRLTSRHIKHLRVVKNRAKLLTLMPSNGIVAEVGVDEGNYSEKILSIAKPKILHLIDAWGSQRFGEDKFNKVQSRFAAEVERGQVVIHRGVSWDELQKFPDAYFDWIYLDTSHTYEDTAKELAVSRLKVKPDGLISGHDYTVGNIKRSLLYGVIHAVNELCINHGWEMIYLTHEPNRYLSYVLHRT